MASKPNRKLGSSVGCRIQLSHDPINMLNICLKSNHFSFPCRHIFNLCHTRLYFRWKGSDEVHIGSLGFSAIFDCTLFQLKIIYHIDFHLLMFARQNMRHINIHPYCAILYIAYQHLHGQITKHQTILFFFQWVNITFKFQSLQWKR